MVQRMFIKSVLLPLVALSSLARCQTFTLSGCHWHDGQEYCYLPNGSEVPFTRSASSTPSAPTQTTAPAAAEASATPAAIPESLTDCHAHGATQFCLASGTEYEVLGTPTGALPTAYVGCHSHGDDMFCSAPAGGEVAVAMEGAGHSEEESHEGHDHEHDHSEGSSEGLDCHFHAGVEHCVGAGQSESSERSCEAVARDYNIPLRVGLIFVVLAGSALAVFSPILLQRFTKITLNSIVFTILKQFGTGVIISTAFVHLLTHSELMFANECLGELQYEATASSIAMAGVFLSFLVEYIGSRLVMRRILKSNPASDNEHQVSVSSKEPANESPDRSLAGLGHSHAGLAHPDNHFSVAVMESGIVFHSILIGITLNVTPDSFYTTLFVVILFHQMFEGLALGTRIASLQDSTSLWIKLLMAAIFALITPIGMAIGAGVLSKFNGNDPSTIVAIGTLDALSAGILLWVGLVEMLAHDWMSGDIARAGWMRAFVGMVSLVVGLAIMSLLGKWA